MTAGTTYTENTIVVLLTYSDNDEWVTEQGAQAFGESLNAKLVLDANRGHFTYNDDVTQLPSVLNEILERCK
ncbi:MAG: alpha/beta hydrolase [Candidatus Micrarchaeales archaeon]